MKNVITKTILEQIDVEALQPDFSVLKVIPKSQAASAKALIFDKDGATLAILTTNEKPDILQKILETFAAKKIKYKIYYTDARSFDKAMLRYDQLAVQEELVQKQLLANATATGKSAEKLLQDLYTQRTAMDDGQFINEIIRLTFQAGASDVHFQPQVGGIDMRMRKDGVMKPLLQFTHAEFKKYLLKIKFMAGTKMNIDYMPQDGRFDFMVGTTDNKKKIDVRVSIMPGLRGEGVVMRFLDAQDGFKTFTDLGFSEEQVEIVKRQLHQNYGMILITGPTGSGKSTTLYSMLNYLNLPGKKIITLEDPVEYELPGVEQSQINASKGYTFEEGLKSLLRHDPDIVMVGEIRTAETAEIALNVALTGHLVLATLHTNTAIEAITRLLNLGIKPYMLAPALNLVVGQRLVRKLHTCMTWREASDAEKQEVTNVVTTIHDVVPRMKIEFTDKVPHAVGCSDCQTDGYKGRLAAIELLEMNADIRQMVVDGKTTMDIYGEVRQGGYLTMKEDAYLKMLNGDTTIEEIRRVL